MAKQEKRNRIEVGNSSLLGLEHPGHYDKQIHACDRHLLHNLSQTSRGQQHQSPNRAGLRINFGTASRTFRYFVNFVGKNAEFLAAIRTLQLHFIQALITLKSWTMRISHNILSSNCVAFILAAPDTAILTCYQETAFPI